MPLTTIRQPSSGEIIELTDWIEAIMVAEQRNKISRSRLRRYFRNMMTIDENDLAPIRQWMVNICSSIRSHP